MTDHPPAQMTIEEVLLMRQLVSIQSSIQLLRSVQDSLELDAAAVRADLAALRATRLG